MTISRRSFAKGAVAAGLLGGTAVARAQSLPKLLVRVDFSPWGMHAGLHLGVEKGWFKEAGLDVEVSDGKGTGIVLPQVAWATSTWVGCSSAPWRWPAERGFR